MDGQRVFELFDAFLGLFLDFSFCLFLIFLTFLIFPIFLISGILSQEVQWYGKDGFVDGFSLQDEQSTQIIQATQAP